MLSVNKGSFLFFYSICLFALIFSSCFDAPARIFSMMSNRHGESRPSRLFLILGGNNYNNCIFFTVKYDVNYSFL